MERDPKDNNLSASLLEAGDAPTSTPGKGLWGLALQTVGVSVRARKLVTGFWINDMEQAIGNAKAAMDGGSEDTMTAVHSLHLAQEALDARINSLGYSTAGTVLLESETPDHPDVENMLLKLSSDHGLSDADMSKAMHRSLSLMHEKVKEIAKATGGLTPVKELYKLRRLLERVTEQLTVSGLKKESARLYIPDNLVGVGYPGNPKKTGQATGAGAGLDGTALAKTKAWKRGDIPLIGGLLKALKPSPVVEWCLRVGLSETLALLLVLHPSAPAFLHRSVWLVVLSLATAKPTLGDTLEGWWIAASGGFIGLALATVLVPLATLGKLGGIVAMCIGFGALSLTFGEHVQGRWAMLPLISTILNVANNGDILAGLGEGVSPWLGMCFGGLCGAIASLLPLPALASEQVKLRMAGAYRIAARLHAVLLVSLMQKEEPRVLHNRTNTQLEMLEADLKNLRNLINVARWEYWLLSPFARAEMTSMLKFHTSLLYALAVNLRLRLSRRDDFGRGSPLHQAISKPNSHKPLFLCARYSALMLRDIASELLDINLDSALMLRERQISFQSAHGFSHDAWSEALRTCLKDAVGSSPEATPKAPPGFLQQTTNLCQSLWGVHEFHERLLEIDVTKYTQAAKAAAKEKAKAAPVKKLDMSAMELCRMLIPGVFAGWGDLGVSRVQATLTSSLNIEEHHPQLDSAVERLMYENELAVATRSRRLLAARSTLMLVVSASLGWVQLNSVGRGSSTAWAPSDLVSHLPIFCPISVIFIFQPRSHTNIFAQSRMWRWLIGTYLGCVFALFFMYFSGDSMLTLGIELVAFAMIFTRVHHDGDYGYAGLVAAFTAPIIAVGFDWDSYEAHINHAESFERRAMSRLSQSFLGCAVTVLITFIWQTDAERARPLLKTHLQASQRGLTAALKYIRDRSGHAKPEPRVIGRAVRQAARRLHAEMGSLRSLLAESKAEPSIYSVPPLPSYDYDGALRGLEGTWMRLLELLGLSYRTLATSTGAASRCRTRFNQICDSMLKAVERTVEKIVLAAQARGDRDASDRYDGQIRKMYDLQGELSSYWHSIDDSLGALMAELIQQSASKDTAHEKHPVTDYIAQGAALGLLKQVAEHVYNMAWRYANIIEKEHPSGSFMAEPYDLYKNEVAV
uniref:Integral membrane bound transporter domain-containing protein n=1 Tax=Calcidiscus leptoporus TaxID=127549 RepID=A0A7S0P2H5_9EUKA|mmetsp:Transcript_51981/g.119578  ORF Transcript_51981/g.119578 Transcript_51981/m.119578 type:complete len:1145 (+) Transcript_51981:185-3619(+)|eukprot:CAMPEP_0119362768 /NCGR_PEP_ID=MMETSP1334-20130426/9715_1 /TAXON_ID=127549 /ORGANISM="Calcidiscus leptoporus, Strain RCC1130" /LENGTH=1144 /DNA_ID=CAMNT_0007378019 /DNA_START=179 /DNA_END=3613 /DNA_ORIENTATION=-